jgi:hypothetical protein
MDMMLSDFLPSGWFASDGVTITADSQEDAQRVGSGSWKMFVSAGVVFLGISASTVLVPSNSVSISSNRGVIAGAAPNGELSLIAQADDVPVGYWATMDRVLRLVPTLPPDDMSSDPPPLG